MNGDIAYVKVRTLAACLDEPLGTMFGLPYQQAEAAQRLCAVCPVTVECFEEGKDEQYGLWGGIPEKTPGRPVGVNGGVNHTVGESPVGLCRCHNCSMARWFAREDRRNGDGKVAA